MLAFHILLLGYNVYLFVAHDDWLVRAIVLVAMGINIFGIHMARSKKFSK